MLSVRPAPEFAMLDAVAAVISPTIANLPVLIGHAKVALPPLRLKHPQLAGGALLRMYV
jgi:hypothetical protein